LKQALEFLRQLELEAAAGHRRGKSQRIVARLSFLNNVGLDYLSLDRRDTLSGGEAQRSGLPARSVGTHRSDVRAR